MKCILHQGTGLEGLRLGERAKPVAARGRAVVRLKAAALNHRDLWSARGREANEPAVVLGSDGAGIVEAVGEDVARVRPGDTVIINPCLGWRWEPQAAPEPGYPGLILGDPEDGTFAQFVSVPAENLKPKPPYLSFEEAAALPIAGVTVYRALFTKAHLKAGESVAIPGIGAGTSVFALQFAKTVGAKVFVTSRAKAKLKRAIALGADGAFDTASAWPEEVKRLSEGLGAHVALESVGAATFAKSLACLRLGGKLIVFGATSGSKVELDLRAVFLRWISLIGTTMGSAAEFDEMLDFVAAHRIVPVIDKVFPLEEGVVALHYLANGGQLGKVVLAMAD